MFFDYKTVYWFILFAIFFYRSSLALDYVDFNEISSKIIELNEMHKNQQHVKYNLAKIALLEQISSLKNNCDEEKKLFELLVNMIKFDGNNYIKFNELIEVLIVLKKMSDDEQNKIVFLRELILGLKEIKNVVITGRTRSGKSTFLSMLIDPFDKELKDKITRDSLFSHTISSSHHWVIFKSYKKGYYLARLIDTPGLNEIKAIGSPMSARSDGEIIEHIADSIKGLKIHRILQIFPLAGSFDRADLRAFDTLSKTLSEREIFHGPIDLVFPKADQMKQKTLRNLIKELMTIFPTYAQEHGQIPRKAGEIFMSGTWFNYLFEGGYASSVMDCAPSMLFLRNKILHSIFGEEFLEYVDVDELNFVSLNQEAAQKLESLIPNQKDDEYGTRFVWDLDAEPSMSSN